MFVTVWERCWSKARRNNNGVAFIIAATLAVIDNLHAYFSDILMNFLRHWYADMLFTFDLYYFCVHCYSRTVWVRASCATMRSNELKTSTADKPHYTDNEHHRHGHRYETTPLRPKHRSDDRIHFVWDHRLELCSVGNDFVSFLFVIVLI